MSDIVERLRETRGVLDNKWPGPTAMDLEAAAEIERLRSALEPFAKIANFCHPRHRDARPFIFGFDTAIAQRLTVGDLRRAATALASDQRGTENG